MVLSKENKSEIISQYKAHEGDTGSSEVQIALLTKRIEGLVEHLKKNTKDNHSRRGLIVLVGQRKRLLNYLHRVDNAKYKTVTTSLDLA